MPRETLQFKEISSKTGTSEKTGNPYTIFTLVDSTGRKFKTFRKHFEIDTPYELDYTEEEKSFVNEEGRTINYVDRFIPEQVDKVVGKEKEETALTSPPPIKTPTIAPQPQIQAPSSGKEIVRLLTEMNLKLGNLEWAAKQILANSEDSERLSNEEIDKVDKQMSRQN